MFSFHWAMFSPRLHCLPFTACQLLWVAPMTSASQSKPKQAAEPRGHKKAAPGMCWLSKLQGCSHRKGTHKADPTKAKSLKQVVISWYDMESMEWQSMGYYHTSWKPLMHTFDSNIFKRPKYENHPKLSTEKVCPYGLSNPWNNNYLFSTSHTIPVHITAAASKTSAQSIWSIRLFKEKK